MLNRVLHGTVTVAVLYLLWFIFVDKLARDEAVVGLGAAALSGAAVEIVRGEEHPRFLPHIRWLLESWRVPGYIVRGCWVLMRKLAGRIFLGDRSTGIFQLVRFDAGGEDKRSVARRALAIIFTTLPPNFLIVGIERDRNWMLFHQVEKDAVPEITRILGVQA